jgi:hypothetical protein
MTAKKNPYIGPQPFQQEDESLFFGRNTESNELFSFIFAHRALLLYAQSGAGKTSLMNASVIPKLRNEGFEVLPVARVGISGEDILNADDISNIYAYNTLLHWSGENENPVDLSQSTITGFLGKEDHPRLLVFDQFEELFTTSIERWKDRKAFVKQLAEALKNDPFLRLVLVIREDYLAQIDPLTPYLPEKLRARYRLERLKAPQALQAIVNPLEGYDRSFADGVTEKLIQDLLKIKVDTMDGKSKEVDGEFIEPVQLQLVCHSLWNKMPADVKLITKDHLKAFSDIDKVLSEF